MNVQVKIDEEALAEVMRMAKEPFDKDAYVEWLGKKYIALELEARQLRQQNEELEDEVRDLRRKNLKH